MAAYHTCIGWPWILDVLAKYGQGVVKQKPVLAQVIEFVKMPNLSAEGSQYPEVAVHISDQKYYIRAVLTREAQETLEREDEHFTVADIKNKLIILKKFSVCFTAVEELKNCEFYLCVQHLSVMAMETNAVDLLNCNMDPGVWKIIKELWQNYMKECEMRETSGMNSSDVCLTQLLMVESEEKFRALKSIAEHCLDLNPFETQEIPAQARTNWGNKKNENSFSVPMHLLLIPPHEESALEQMTEYRTDVQLTSDVDACCDTSISPQLYSTAISSLSAEPMDDGPSSQSRNPWNKLQPLCISVATCSDSQPGDSRPVKQWSGEEDLVPSPDSSTPEILMSHLDVSAMDFTESQNEISPLTFSETSKNPQPPETKTLAQAAQSIDSSSTSGLCGQRSFSDTSLTSPVLKPLTQDSRSDCSNMIPDSPPQGSFTMGSKVQICPVLSYSSDSENRPRIRIGHISPNHDRSREMYSLRRRKVMKRKLSSDDSESTLSDLEQQTPMCVDRTRCVSTLSGVEVVTSVTRTDSHVQTAPDKQLEDRNRTEPVLDEGRTEHAVTAGSESPKICRKITVKKWVQSKKPSLEFVTKQMLVTEGSESTLSSALEPTTSRANQKEASSSTTRGQANEKRTIPVIDKLTHYDGTPFQYKYKLPTADLCARVNAIRIPADLCEWALNILSDHKEKSP
ncbi:adrenocortical dysplasia protein homolog isoform X2 [Pseudophryne corroboree]|uniref:adrenocortical dysplasia protein homolog isoform X2 n=1 Tax=Pseudophryne corroboree TaxID=495146 RepID=UPI003081A68D